MAKSLLSTFVTSTRALLIAQLIACVGAVALAGWTLGVTNQVLRERNRLQERVIQLEEAMAASGVIPPPPTAVVAPSSQSEAYPGSLANARALTAMPDADGDSIAVADTSERNIGMQTFYSYLNVSTTSPNTSFSLSNFKLSLF